MQTILVTGGLGFIGREFINNLSGYKVICLDNELRWKKQDLDISFEFIKGDICDESIVDKLIKKSDIILHLAAVSQVRSTINDPDTCFKYNVIGTNNIAKYCALHKKKLIFASSREVYGNQKKLPVSETIIHSPENPYGYSKSIAEQIILMYSKSFGLEYLIFRFSNIYGIGDKERVIPIFIQKSLKNQDLVIYGDNKLIDFLYITDLIELLKIAIQSDIKNDTFNAGSGQSISLEKLAKLIIKSTKSKSKIVHKEGIKGEVDIFQADISKSFKIFKWKPTTSIDKGLKEMVR